MQKKLLLLFMAVNCVMVQADGSKASSEKDYTDYINQQSALYQSAWINYLSGDENAIDDEDKKNKEENDKEEQENRKKQYDGIPGWFSSEPTVESKTGQRFQQYAEYKASHNEINKKLSEKAKSNKDKFNTEILPKFKHELENDRYFINSYCLSALQECGKDLGCYDDKGLSAKIFTNSNFGQQHEDLLYACVARFASERGVYLTSEELKMIAEHNQATQEYFEGIQDGLRKMDSIRDDILNPKAYDAELK